MTINEVLKESCVLRKESWFRPVGWRGEALTLNSRNKICLVPSSNPETPISVNNISVLVGEWEIVDPEVVLCEKEYVSKAVA